MKSTISPSGKFSAFWNAYDAGDIKIFKNGQLYLCLTEHLLPVNCVRFSPNDVISTSEDGSALLWDISQVQFKTLLSGYADVFGAEFSPDGQWLAINVHTVQLWDMKTQEFSYAIKDFDVHCISFSFDSRYIAGGNGNFIYIWDLHTQKLTTIDTGSYVSHTCFSPKESKLVSCNTDGVLSVCSVSKKLFQVRTLPLYKVSFSPKGDYLAGEGTMGQFYLLETNGYREVAFRTKTPFANFYDTPFALFNSFVKVKHPLSHPLLMARIRESILP